MGISVFARLGERLAHFGCVGPGQLEFEVWGAGGQALRSN